MKYFIITVDTEGDNLWEYNEGEQIGTENARYIPRFQQLCEQFGFKPVYLTNYEMAKCDIFVSYAREWIKKGTCEIGVHLHAWNNPPIIELQGPYNGNPYLIEYVKHIMNEKFEVLFNLLKDRFNIEPISHRAGRWAMDERYFRILKSFGIKVDCSYTPGVNWNLSKGVTRGGTDYTLQPQSLQWIDGVLEVPATIRRFRNCMNGTFKHRLKSFIFGEDVWLRPAMSSLSSMKKVLDVVYNEKDVDFIEFMIHSSELMPNGSPYFKTEDAVEKEYSTMEALFKYAKENGFEGVTLKEYYLIHENSSDHV